MDLNRWLRAIAGVMVLLSVFLANYVSPYWYLFTIFIGLNLLQSAFTGFCPLALILKKMGKKPGMAF